MAFALFKGTILYARVPMGIRENIVKIIHAIMNIIARIHVMIMEIAMLTELITTVIVMEDISEIIVNCRLVQILFVLKGKNAI